MTDYDSLLRKVENAVQSVSDEGLRRIAFDRLLSHELEFQSERSTPQTQESPTRNARQSKPRNKPPSASQPSSGRQEVQNLDISPDDAGLPPWSSLGALDKYLWILEAAHKKGIEALSASEISGLIFKIFRESHGTNQVNNLKTRIRQQHVRTTKDGWQILKAGKERLQARASKDATGGS